MADPSDNDEYIPTRASLLGRLKDWNDQESWKNFFDTYWKMLYSVARRSGLGDAQAQDIVQETIAAVAKKMPDFVYDPKLGSFKTWLVVIIRRRIIDHFRRVGREPDWYRPGTDTAAATGTGVMEKIPDPDAGALDRIYEEEWQKNIYTVALERVRKRVDAKQFQMFDCYAIKEWPVADVAKNLDVTVAMVYTAKHRVSELIKDEAQRLALSMM
jgi:RNA polymerase sigma-70 factor (ECF subfamily)